MSISQQRLSSGGGGGGNGHGHGHGHTRTDSRSASADESSMPEQLLDLRYSRGGCGDGGASSASSASRASSGAPLLVESSSLSKSSSAGDIAGLNLNSMGMTAEEQKECFNEL